MSLCGHRRPTIFPHLRGGLLRQRAAGAGFPGKEATMTPETRTPTPRARTRKEKEARPADDPPPEEDRSGETPEDQTQFRDWALI
jgi:hypothetical protein